MYNQVHQRLVTAFRGYVVGRPLVCAAALSRKRAACGELRGLDRECAVTTPAPEPARTAPSRRDSSKLRRRWAAVLSCCVIEKPHQVACWAATESVCCDDTAPEPPRAVPGRRHLSKKLCRRPLAGAAASSGLRGAWVCAWLSPMACAAMLVSATATAPAGCPASLELR
jgi:hypothetical protein